MSREEIGILWNLDCAGMLARDDWPFAHVPDDVLFRADGDTLRVLGTIDRGFAGALRRALDAAPRVTRVALASRGGNMGEAMDAGDLIAERGLDTGLAGHCVSACVLVYLGGRARDLPDGPDLLGFHQASWPGGQPVWVANPFQLQLFLYLAGTGARAGTLDGLDAAGPARGNAPARPRRALHGRGGPAAPLRRQGRPALARLTPSAPRGLVGRGGAPMPKPFDAAITRYFEDEAPKDVRRSIEAAKRKEIVTEPFPYDRWIGQGRVRGPDGGPPGRAGQVPVLGGEVRRPHRHGVFEGRDAAGKGGTIRRMREKPEPARRRAVVALSKPTETEAGKWYFQRYLRHMPTRGEMTLFDRSWYNRAVVEHVFGFCEPAEREAFFAQLPAVEKLLVDDGIVLVKLWLNVGPRRAAAPHARPRGRPPQAVEAEPHRRRRAGPVGRLHRRDPRHVRPLGLRLRALDGRALGRQAPRAGSTPSPRSCAVSSTTAATRARSTWTRRSRAARSSGWAVPKRGYHHGNLRQALVEAALALIEEKGPDRASPCRRRPSARA